MERFIVSHPGGRSSRPSSHLKPRAFTLVELLVVIGNITVLISLLMPALNKARQSAQQVVCSSNLRQMMFGFQMFIGEHKGYMPGGYYDQADRDPERRDWLLGPGPDYKAGPQKGTIYPYVNKSLALYRCPSLDPSAPGSGGGSNGRFDYSMFLSWTGAKVTNIRPESRFTYTDGRVETVPSPIIVEEDPAHYINSGSLEGGHASIDEMAKNHRHGANYGCIDGSVQFFKEPPGSTTYQWTSQAPSGKWMPLGQDVLWGTWNKE